MNTKNTKKTRAGGGHAPSPPPQWRSASLFPVPLVYVGESASLFLSSVLCVAEFFLPLSALHAEKRQSVTAAHPSD